MVICSNHTRIHFNTKMLNLDLVCTIVLQEAASQNSLQGVCV